MLLYGQQRGPPKENTVYTCFPIAWRGFGFPVLTGVTFFQNSLNGRSAGLSPYLEVRTVSLKWNQPILIFELSVFNFSTQKTDIDRNSISPISPEIFGLRPFNNHPPLTVHGFAALKSSRSGGQNAALESASFLDVQSSLGKTYQLMIDGCSPPQEIWYPSNVCSDTSLFIDVFLSFSAIIPLFSFGNDWDLM